MNAVLDFHDSHLAGIQRTDTTLILQLRPAILHLSTGQPGTDAGAVHVQDIDMIFSQGTCEGDLPPEEDRDIIDGTLSLSGHPTFVGQIPAPLPATGAAACTLEFGSTTLRIAASTVHLEMLGDSRFLEKFPPNF